MRRLSVLLALLVAVLGAAPATAAPAHGRIVVKTATPFPITGTQAVLTGAIFDASGRRVPRVVVELWQREWNSNVVRHTQNVRTNALGEYTFRPFVRIGLEVEIRYAGGSQVARTVSSRLLLRSSVDLRQVLVRGCDIDLRGYPHRIASTLRIDPANAGSSWVGMQTGVWLRPRTGGAPEWLFREQSPVIPIEKDGTTSRTLLIQLGNDDPLLAPDFLWVGHSDAGVDSWSRSFSLVDPDMTHWGKPGCYLLPANHDTPGT